MGAPPQKDQEHNNLHNSEATSINSTVFTKLVEEIQKDIEAVAQQADEMPLGLLHEIPAIMTSSSESPAR
jgi:hypothetical protein